MKIPIFAGLPLNLQRQLRVFPNSKSLLLNSGADNAHRVDRGPAINALLGASSSAMSVSVWMRPETGHDPVSGNAICGATTAMFDDGWGIYFLGSDDIRCIVDDIASAGTFNNINGGTSMSGSWWHLVMVYDGSRSLNDRIRLHVNTVDQGTGADSVGTSVTWPANAVCLGALYNDNTNSFRGHMDEYAIFDYALGSADIIHLYGGGRANDAETTPGGAPKMYWRCGDDPSDDATAGTGQITDQISTGHGIPQATTGDPSFDTLVPA